ncbi:MAG TPA: PEP/pyruvate-binding domain-containing protein, partial [Actinomycetota bacterium]|nr:PEP/pyruvate-binding domain-containing protein [Actinomycetota bacterium]
MKPETIGVNRQVTYVVDLADPAATEPDLAGGKGASLARASRVGYPVPPGFVVGLPFFELVEREGWDDARSLLMDDLEPALSRLAGPVAVRSSARGEDGESNSFAGQHETLLNLTGTDAVLEAIARCWESSRSARVREYEKTRDVTQRGFAVVIQRMVVPDVSLVAFTVDPVTGDREHVVVDATCGLGESLVGGMTNTDTYVVRKRDLAITSRVVRDKDRMVVPVEGGTEMLEVPPDKRLTPTLDDESLRAVARVAVRLEAETGNAVDIEAALVGDELVLLQSRPVTAAPAFPVVWNEGESDHCWYRGGINFPDPVSPLFGSWLRRVFCEGCSRALKIGGPAVRLVGRRINTFWYEAEVPLDLSPEERSVWLAECEEALERSLDDLGDKWDNSFVPALLSILASLESTDLGSLSDDGLVSHLGAAMEMSVRGWEIHFSPLTSGLVAVNELEKLCVEVLGEDGRVLAWEILQGLDNKTLEMERALRVLAGEAAGNEDVRDVILTRSAAVAIASLRGAADETTPGGSSVAAFLKRLDEFLFLFGRRFPRFELMAVPWREDPAPVIEVIRLMIGAGNHNEPDPGPEAAARAEVALRRLHDSLSDLQPEIQARFERLLAAARAGIVIMEDHAFYIDGALQYEMRRIVMEAGTRLATKGVIRRRDDVFMLTLEEIAASLTGSAGGSRDDDVRERRAEMERWRGFTPPATLGAPPPADEESRVAEAWENFGGRRVTVTRPDGTMLGVAASPGRASGVAKIIRSLDDANRVAPGDVLVVENTSSVWVPLLSSAAAFVTERGGPLSHCAIIAREYGVPAVLGLDAATTR